MKLYSIVDLVAKSATVPFAAENDDHAQRLLFDSFSSNPQAIQTRHSEDFSLVFLGEFDIRTGEISKVGKPSFVASLKSILSTVPASASEHVITNPNELKT